MNIAWSSRDVSTWLIEDPLEDYTAKEVTSTGFSVLTSYGDRLALQSDYYRGADGKLADSFAIEVTKGSTLKVVMGVGAAAFLLVLTYEFI